MVDEDDDEPEPIGRATLKRQSQDLINAHNTPSGFYNPQQTAYPGKPSYQQRPPPQRQPLGTAPDRPPDRSQWQITPEMMNQPWGVPSPPAVGCGSARARHAPRPIRAVRKSSSTARRPRPRLPARPPPARIPLRRPARECPSCVPPRRLRLADHENRVFSMSSAQGSPGSKERSERTALGARFRPPSCDVHERLMMSSPARCVLRGSGCGGGAAGAHRPLRAISITDGSCRKTSDGLSMSSFVPMVWVHPW